MTTPTPLAQRLVRLARLSLHLLQALVLAALVYPGKTASQQGAMRRRWSRRLLDILHISLEAHGTPKELPQRCLIASNHISWLDIFVVNAALPATFVSKAEVARWPLIGWLCTRAGTLYIERGSKNGARRANRSIVHALERGVPVAICPEGTTSYGDELLRFHAALFQPAVDAVAQVLPVTLCYRGTNDAVCVSAAYVGDDSLLDSIWAIVSTRHISASIAFLPPIASDGLGRRELAGATEAAIAAALGVPVPARAAGKHGHLQAVPQ
jgi:1-acyl-sn-glycerol-3-phosphate acyltransferase